MVKVRLVAVRRLTPLHSAHGPAPDAIDQVLGQIVGQRMDLAPTASHEVNMVRAVQGARAPSHEDHLHDVGDAQVIAAHDFNVPKCRPPGLPPLVAMDETFAPARLVAQPFTGGDHGISGETAEHALLAPDPADILDAMYGHPPIVAPRQPRRGILFRPYGANVARDRLANVRWFLTLQQRGQLLDPVLDSFHDGMTGVSDPFRGIRNAVDQTLGNVLSTIVAGITIRGHVALLSTRLRTGQAHNKRQQLLDGERLGEENGVIRHGQHASRANPVASAHEYYR
jgi:hypothetical protein